MSSRQTFSGFVWKAIKFLTIKYVYTTCRVLWTAHKTKIIKIYVHTDRWANKEFDTETNSSV